MSHADWAWPLDSNTFNLDPNHYRKIRVILPNRPGQIHFCTRTTITNLPFLHLEWTPLRANSFQAGRSNFITHRIATKQGLTNNNDKIHFTKKLQFPLLEAHYSDAQECSALRLPVLLSQANTFNSLHLHSFLPILWTTVDRSTIQHWQTNSETQKKVCFFLPHLWSWVTC